MSESAALQINVSHKKHLKRKYPCNNSNGSNNNTNNSCNKHGCGNYRYRNIDGIQEEDDDEFIDSTQKHRSRHRRFSWIKLLNFSFAMNLVHILSFKCSVNVNYPHKEQVSHAILLIPRLCKQTVNYTYRLFFGYLHPPSHQHTDSIDNRRCSRQISYNDSVSTGEDESGGENVENQSQAARLHRLIRVLGFQFFSPLFYLMLCPAVFAYKTVRLSKRTKDRRAIGSIGWQVKCYRTLPLKSLSKGWGYVNNINLPLFLRKPVLSTYVKVFHCDLSEAEVEDLKYYKNLGELFRRSLKNGVRPIASFSPIVSPADGTVLHFGKVEGGIIEQVKGVAYSISQFLGPPTWEEDMHPVILTKSMTDCERFTKAIMHHKDGSTSLFHCVIYLAPGDYHRFHSPVEWNAKFRRHFAGELLSVNPKVAKFISGLFSLNERAVYTGEWEHGFFSFTAVGATNVGSIRVYQDSELHTNARRQRKGQRKDKIFENPLSLHKGENFGEFNLGSTIVLIFEAPTDFKFNLQHGSNVKVGESLIEKPLETES